MLDDDVTRIATGPESVTDELAIYRDAARDASS